MSQSSEERLAKNNDLSDKLAQLHQQKSLLIASLNADGSPLISYAPFYEHNGMFYIFISYLAEHTPNLIERPQASMMLLQDEEQTNNLFVRARVRYEVNCRVISRDQSLFDEVLLGLEARQGKMVSLLRSLGDFYLIALEPIEGSLVVGAGAAYSFKPGIMDFEQVRGR
ncbi:MAG: pyridoxamine 5'-phosphate oxidase family protein [Alcaligenaceae bacterium]|nr:pyridoxamine 5'-phosphate oxidase family protein [Alcaligenaceae bacterium]